MKTDIRDYLYSSLSISFLLAISILITCLLSGAIDSISGIRNLLLSILLFIAVYGLSTVIYVGALSRIYPLKEGAYEMDHAQFTLWKHHAITGELGRAAIRLFIFPVFLRPLFYSLFGAKIGRYVAIGGTITDPLLIKVDDYAILGQDSVLTSHTMIFNKFYLKPITVGKGATVGINAVIMPGVEIGENSVVAPGAVVSMDTKIPPNEFWGGVPARKIKDLEPL
ncbi:MAG TPA: DapH/DapD/GlmU-related protein [Thermodesulfobacteriota bacterium]